MKHQNRFRLCAAVLGLSLLAPMRMASAEVVVFTDSIDFFVATGATDASGALPDLGMPTNLTSIDLGSVTISAPRFGISDWSDALAGAEIAISLGAGDVGGNYNEGIDVSFDGPVFSAGFDFVEPNYNNTNQGPGCNLTCVDSQFAITLLNGSTELGTFSFSPADNVAAFFGVWSDVAFDGMQIREVIGSNDNEYYGRFYTGMSPVPVPAAVWLFGSALLGLAGMRRRR